AYYFHVLGVDGLGNAVGNATFGPMDTDLSAPTVASVAAQKSAVDNTPIADGGSTLSTTPRFTWPAAGSVSPVVGYSLSVTTDATAQPPQIVGTTLNFADITL